MGKIIKKLVAVSLIVFVIMVTILFTVYVLSNRGMISVGSRGLADNNAGATTSTGQQTQPGADQNNITATVLAKHNQADDCWLLIKGRIYDVSSYINQHPGGRGIIINNCGKEVTGMFASIHSNRAWNLLTKYDVGGITTATDMAMTKSANETLISIETARASLETRYQNMNIIDIKPGTKGETVAKVVYKGALMELHLDGSGQVISEETVNDEQDWEAFNEDEDD